MSRVNAQARICGFQREKQSRLLKLKKEVKKKLNIVRFEATMGIVGIPESGRKTLAYRLCNMNRGVIRGAPAAFFYTASDLRRFEVPPSYVRFSLRISIYIIPQPEMPPSITRSETIQHTGPPLYLEHWNNFCCLLMAFDVRNLISYHLVSLLLRCLRQENYHVPTCFFVGTKSDQRFDSQPSNLEPHERLIPYRDAELEAENLGIPYIEVSARYHVNVEYLFDNIFERAFATLRY